MISSIYVFSYWQMFRFAPQLPEVCAVVSILNPMRGHSNLCDETGCPPGCGDYEAAPIFEDDPRVLALRFWDVDEHDSPDPAFYREWPPITEAQGRLIADFLAAAHRDPEPMSLFAHCAAGNSRSAAVGEAASILTGIPLEALKFKPPDVSYAMTRPFHPNATVKAYILRAWRADGIL